MLVAILQVVFNFILKLSIIFGLTFMVACTVFVIYCMVHGDIEIDVRNKTEKEKK